MTAFLSVVTGAGAALLWVLGNHLSQAHTFWLVLIAIPGNFIAALLFYLLIRGAVHTVKGGLGSGIFACAINLAVTIWLAFTILESMDASPHKIGAHAFTWGMGFAYGQALKDIRAGTWFGE